MKRAVAAGAAALGLIALAILLRKDPAELPQPSKPPPSASREIPAAPVSVPAPAPSRPAPAAPADPRSLLADLAKALRNGDEKTVRALLKRLHDQIYPPLPDDQNAAVVYKKAFDLAREKMGGFSMKGLDRSVYSAFLSEKETTPEQWAALGAWFETNGAAAAEATALLREAGKRTQCRFPEQTQQMVTGLSYASNLLRIAATAQQQAGKTDEAAENAIAGLAMARSIRSTPNFTCQLLGFAFDDLTMELFRSSLNPTTPRIAGWLDAADPAAVRASYMAALLGEVDWTIDHILGLKADPGGVVDAELRKHLESPLLFQDLATYVDGVDSFAKLAGRPYFETREELETLTRQHGELAPWYASLAKDGLSPMLSLSRVIARSEARTAMAKLSLELSRYQTKNGSYPAALDALSSRPPIDPFTGRPFLYRREGAGFVIESAGDGKRPLTWTRR